MAQPRYKLDCQICGAAFVADRRHARQCSGACRQRAYRRRIAADLLKRQTRAIIDGADPAVLDVIAREAQDLLGDADEEAARPALAV